MKLLLSILMFPSFLALITGGLCCGFYFCCHELPLAGEYSFSGHILKAFLYIAMGLGLSCSVFSVLAGIILTILSFVFKSWTRATASAALVFFGGSLWQYFLTVTVPS